jgi:8-oxo-dGTP diphosphatase
MEFLLGQRAPGTFYPGYWEFPGGKVEPGETAHAALVRELGEELGIGVTRADPWLRREHVYEHAHVRLNFFRVRDWCGELHDHVHSALAWQRADALTVAPMLPANAPVLAALALPDFYAISHAGEIGIDAQLLALARAGIRPAAGAAARAEARCRAPRGLRPCRGRPLPPVRRAGAGQWRPALAAGAGADGVHLPARQLAALRAAGFRAGRGVLPFAAELERAAKLGCDLRCSARCADGQPSGCRRHRLGGIGRGARRAATADFCPGRVVARRPRCRPTRRRPRHRGDPRRLG